jgi:CheY-like chemotaxis protein
VYVKTSPNNGTTLIHEDVQMRVLIAEDDAALASFVRKGLEAEHYAVDVATDGEQAKAMAPNSTTT